jgi:hypothetical protein
MKKNNKKVTVVEQFKSPKALWNSLHRVKLDTQVDKVIARRFVSPPNLSTEEIQEMKDRNLYLVK